MVLERDGDAKPGSPDDAWQAWDRRGVAQFRQPHYFHAAGSHILDSRLPEVKEALLRAHGTSFDMLDAHAPVHRGPCPREGDGRFVTVTARRPVIEYAVADTAERHLDVRRGVAVTELLTGPPAAGGVPHVTGVQRLGR